LGGTQHFLGEIYFCKFDTNVEVFNTSQTLANNVATFLQQKRRKTRVKNLQKNLFGGYTTFF